MAIHAIIEVTACRSSTVCYAHGMAGKGHVFLCMLAYHVEWHLRQARAPPLFHDTNLGAARAERASPVVSTEPSKVARTKKATVRNRDGLPVMRFADLMDHLGTCSPTYFLAS
jgi:hypothetical protein